MLHPTSDTIDLQTDLAWDRLHPDCVQSVPTAEFGLSQKLSVTKQACGVMTESVVVPDSSAGTVRDARGTSGFTAIVSSFCDVGVSTPQANMKTAETDIQNTVNFRSICRLPFCLTI
jgi:hypothetical protein